MAGKKYIYGQVVNQNGLVRMDASDVDSGVTPVTYTLSKSGSTITLTGSDGSSWSVTDSDTKYDLSGYIPYKKLSSIKSVAGTFWADNNSGISTSEIPSGYDGYDWAMLQIAEKGGYDKTQFFFNAGQVFVRGDDAVPGSESWTQSSWKMLYNGSYVPIAAGGTGSTTAAGALSNLGAVAKTGDTMTGSLILNGAGLALAHQWTDSDGTVYKGYLQTTKLTSGGGMLGLEYQIGGSNYNYLRLYKDYGYIGKQLCKGGVSSPWVKGRDNAMIRMTSTPSGAYSPILSAKSYDGSWEVGTYTGNALHFSYITDSNYSAGTNERSGYVYFNHDGSIINSGSLYPSNNEYFPNGYGVYGKDTSGNYRSLIRLNTSNNVHVGDYAQNLLLASTGYSFVSDPNGVDNSWLRVCAWKVLWTNSSPSSAFEAQTLTISNLSSYNLFAIGVNWSSSYSTTVNGMIYYVPSTSAVTIHPSITWYYTYIGATYRPVTITRSSNTVAFGNGVMVTHSKTTSGTAYAVPVYILGAVV